MPALPAPIVAEPLALDDSRTGPMVCWTHGEGPPLLLVHSVNAAASAAEIRPLAEHFARTHRVFAPDLPGFGASDRSDRAYTPRLMTDALHVVLEEIARRCGAAPVDALAVSLGCEFLARAAVEQPTTLRRLALVSPTGFSSSRRRRGPPGSTYAMPWLHRALTAPGWGGPVFRGLTRPGVIRFFLEKTWGSKTIDETLWHYDVLVTRQPGAEHAPLHFISGGLFSADIHDVYERLTQPVWMSHGVRGDFTDYRGKALVEGRANWSFTTYPTGAMPYFEQPQAFCDALQRFLDAPAA